MRLLPIFVCLVLVGSLRMGAEVRWARQVERLALDGTYGSVTGTVAASNDEGDQLVLILERCQAEGRAGRTELRGVQVYLDEELGARLSPKIGNRLQVAGTWSESKRARNPGGFDAWLYSRAMKLDFRMFAETGAVTDVRYSRYREGLRQISRWAGYILEQITAGEDTGIYQAAILGDKTGLEESVRDMYQQNGIAHLLAISGLHMSLIGMAFYHVVRRLGAGFGWAGVAGALLVVSYGAMTGGSASVVRASVMLLCSFGAAYLGRTYDLLSALGLACVLLLWDSPYLITQAGVQLSFGAVLGIGGMTQSCEQFSPQSEKGKVVWKGMSASLCVQLITMPIILYHFFQVPLYGVLLNLVVIPLMGYVVAAGIAGIFAGAVSLQVGIFVVGTGHYILAFYRMLCQVFERLPWSNLILGRPEAWQIAGYYLVLGIVWLGAAKGWLRRRLVAAVGLLAACVILLPLPVKGLEVTFLDVGQGDGICLRTNGETVLVDGGSTDERKLGEYTLEPFLKSKAVTRIDYAWVSHADQDHISGLFYLLEESRDIQIENLMLPASGREDEAYQPLCSLVRQRGGTVFWVERGDVLEVGGVTYTCLSTGAMDAAADRNEQSMVLRVEVGEFHMLLTGDMSADGEQALLEDAAMRGYLSDTPILKLAHHGSRFSNSEPWLEAVKPIWAVASYGKDNRYGHPHKEVRERLGKQGTSLWETAECGAVQVWTDGEVVRWERYRSGEAAQEETRQE